jgi:hypothetical protein
MDAVLLQSLRDAGITKVAIEYYGSGDEGSIGEVALEPSPTDRDITVGQSMDITAVQERLRQPIQDWAYDELERRWPGWEINEGSTGDIEIDVAAGTARLHHGIYPEPVAEYTDEEVTL